jgi:hypothetical protein
LKLLLQPQKADPGDERTDDSGQEQDGTEQSRERILDEDALQRQCDKTGVWSVHELMVSDIGAMDAEARNGNQDEREDKPEYSAILLHKEPPPDGVFQELVAAPDVVVEAEFRRGRADSAVVNGGTRGCRSTPVKPSCKCSDRAELGRDIYLVVVFLSGGRRVMIAK